MCSEMLPAMTDSVLWPLDPHTAAKHRVLRSYLDGWLPVMGRQAQRVRSFANVNPRLLLVDGFAFARRARQLATAPAERLMPLPIAVAVSGPLPLCLRM